MLPKIPPPFVVLPTCPAIIVIGTKAAIKVDHLTALAPMLVPASKSGRVHQSSMGLTTSAISAEILAVRAENVGLR